MNEGVRLELAMPVWSHRLRLSGRCDAVEFHPSGEVVPVEYKLGKRRRWVNDDLQVAAQALCLEEMLGRPVLQGAIFHYKSRRLRKFDIDLKLRQETEEVIACIQALVEGGQAMPPPTEQLQRCGECSMHDICQPEMWRAAHNPGLEL
jgi:CRISPR-associated exonuclease Cas4